MNYLDKLAGALITISQQIVESPDQHEERITLTTDSEVENFLRIIKILLQRISAQQRRRVLLRY